jgi:cytochrome c6
MILNLKLNHKSLIGLLLIVCLSMIALPHLALADDMNSGAKIFEMNCAGCHANGGNIIRRGKNLKKRALKRNGFESVAAISQIVTHGKGNMSAYEDRLTPEEINTVSNYVWQQAEQGWKK